MSRRPLLRLPIAFLAAGLLFSCSGAPGSNWHLAESGYSIDAPDGQEFAVEVHVNQLKQLGGDIRSANFRGFVAERLKLHGLCAQGWEPLPCVADGSCVERTKRSVTVHGRCR
jgi:hypothetical protein